MRLSFIAQGIRMLYWHTFILCLHYTWSNASIQLT